MHRAEVFPGRELVHHVIDLQQPGILQSGKRINVGSSSHGEDCKQLHVEQSTTGGEPWPSIQQMSAIAIKRIHSILAPELHAAFTSDMAGDFTNYLTGSALHNNVYVFTQLCTIMF